MKKNSGMTVVEIIISISIISMVLILLFSLLMHVRNEDLDNSIQSNFVINQSSFIKAIEEDIVNYGVKSISHCSLGDANITTSVAKGFENKYQCVKIEYSADYTSDKIAFVLLYKYYTKYEKKDGSYVGTDSSWVIQYVRGQYTKLDESNKPVQSSWKNRTSLMRIIPSEVEYTHVPFAIYTANPYGEMNAVSFVIPIVNLDGVHYDINLSFIAQGNNTFKCNNSDNSKFDCRCQSSNILCSSTYSN